MDEAGIVEPKDDDIGIGDGNEEKARVGEDDDDVIMYDNEGEIEKQLSKIKGAFFSHHLPHKGKRSKSYDLLLSNACRVISWAITIPCVFTDENQGAGQDLEDEMANYNGDDDNQPESEDEKQAELTGM